MRGFCTPEMKSKVWQNLFVQFKRLSISTYNTKVIFLIKIYSYFPVLQQQKTYYHFMIVIDFPVLSTNTLHAIIIHQFDT